MLKACDTVLVKRKIYNDSGLVISEGYLCHNVPDSLWFTYYESGKLKSKGRRKDGLLDSTWVFYTEEGLVSTSVDYKGGLKNGYRIFYDKIGVGFLIKENFVNDTKVGTSVVKIDSLTLRYIPFIDGKENGLGWDVKSDSLIITLSHYKNGFVTREERINRVDNLGRKQGVYKSFYTTPLTEHIVCHYINNQLDGYLKEFDLQGNLIKIEKWRDGVLQINSSQVTKIDIKKDFYDDGTLRSYVTLKNGLKEGVELLYNDSGRVTKTNFYKNNLLVGTGSYNQFNLLDGKYQEFYNEGEIKASGTYSNGKKIGKWTYYHQNSNVEQSGNYLKDKPNGEWKWFYENGSVLRIEVYNMGLREGPYFEFDLNGDTLIGGQFSDGEPIGEWLIRDNDILSKGVFKDGKQYDIWKSFYYPSLKLCSSVSYIDGLENGKYIKKAENGNIIETGLYNNGNKEGKWTYYDTYGILLYTMEYKNNQDFKIDNNRIPFFTENISSEDLFQVNPKQ
jgi:antitoxin component YwqK of YwqJK toxin-antitoxin module